MLPCTHPEISELSAQVRLLRDHSELRALFDRYLTALDLDGVPEGDETSFGGIFTEDATFTFPIGTCSGTDGFTAFQRQARGRWARTHHLGSGHAISVEGDRATLRVQQLTAHVHHPGDGPSGRFDVGGYSEARALRTEAGWRLSHVAYHVVWDSGDRLPELTGVRL
ncbi:nuclear transport factor 2 family protein [Streptomyces sp. NPDC058279]|uniref:nuclear transport factor 2 family protein n=1 Tax=Streptomyces sp. NPDC058279 TaxID=3346418 RepID=UPI0036E79587